MSDFNKYDELDHAIELVSSDSSGLTSTAILAFLNISELEAVEMWAGNNGCIDSEQALSERYDEMLWEIDAHYGDDYTAFCEDFNNITDNWRNDGLIHSLQYDSYCYVGKHFKDEQ
jgi:hypothetical protein